MPADKALKITADVLAALEISHEMGLVHRDIKPGNVMMTKRGVVKVMDFGIARAMQSGVTSMTQTGMVVGTPQYLSPEQALGRGVDARSDLYSVGIMLFQLVTGRLPFDADSPLAIAYAHVQEEPVAPSSINRALPPAVDALVARALKKNPNERFPSAEAMRDECLRVAASLQPAPPSIVPGAPDAERRRASPPRCSRRSTRTARRRSRAASRRRTSRTRRAEPVRHARRPPRPTATRSRAATRRRRRPPRTRRSRGRPPRRRTT